MKKSIYLLTLVALIVGGVFVGNSFMSDSNGLALADLGKTAYAAGEGDEGLFKGIQVATSCDAQKLTDCDLWWKDPYTYELVCLIPTYATVPGEKFPCIGDEWSLCIPKTACQPCD